MLKVSFQNTVVLGIGLPTTLLMKLDTGGDTPPGIMQITDKDSEPAYAECLTLNWLAVSHSPIADIDAISHIPCTRSEFPDTPRSRGYFFSYPKNRDKLALWSLRSGSESVAVAVDVSVSESEPRARTSSLGLVWVWVSVWRWRELSAQTASDRRWIATVPSYLSGSVCLSGVCGVSSGTLSHNMLISHMSALLLLRVGFWPAMWVALWPEPGLRSGTLTSALIRAQLRRGQSGNGLLS